MKQTIDLTPLEEFFTVDTTPDLFKARIENIRYNYGQYALKDEDACGGQPDVAEDIYYLKLWEEKLDEVIKRLARGLQQRDGHK